MAHGPQIQITDEGGKIVTRELLVEGPYSHTLTAPKSVYVMPLVDNLGVSYARPNNVHFVAPGVPTYYSGPGLAYGYGYDATTNPEPFALGSKFGLAFVDGLKTWNGAAFVDPVAAEFEAFTGGFGAPTGVARTTDAGSFASLPVPAGASTVAFASDGDEAHGSVRYRYLGDGVTPSSAPSGVYLLSLQITSTQSGLQPSDPFYFMLNKNAGLAAVQSAVASLGVAPSQVQFVPEPSSLALAVCGLLAVGRRGGRQARVLGRCGP
jgi:hypothetical protein